MVKNDYADWHPDGFGGVFVALAARITTGVVAFASAAERVEDDAARIAEGAAAFALAPDETLPENE